MARALLDRISWMRKGGMEAMWAKQRGQGRVIGAIERRMGAKLDSWTLESEEYSI